MLLQLKNINLHDTIEFLTAFILCTCIYAPISIYHLYQYFKHRHELIITKRYGNVTIYESLFSIIKLIGHGLMWLSIFFVPRSIANVHMPFLNAISISLTIALDYCLLWRFWLLYFDIKWMVASSNGK